VFPKDRPWESLSSDPVPIYFYLLALGVVILIPVRSLDKGETTSAIAGQLTDSTSAALPGATVTITNRDTGLRRSAKTDDAGRFIFPQLKPGSYSVRVEVQGFEPQQNDGVFSGVGQKQTVNFMLAVARSNQTETKRADLKSAGHSAVQVLYNRSPECSKTPQNALLHSLSHNNIRKTGSIRNRQVIGSSPIVGSIITPRRGLMYK
jgi:hypothetical protein